METSKPASITRDHPRSPGAAAVGFRLCRKLTHLLNKPLTWFDLHKEGVPLRAPATHWERSIILDLRHYLDAPGMTVYDIGASVGNYAAAFAKLRNVGRVYAFEPAPGPYQQLTKRVGGFPHVTCFNLALGDRSGLERFNENNFTFASSILPMEHLHKAEFPQSAESREITVEVERLDDLVGRRGLAPPDLVKIDVQGYEDRVLRGGRATIRSARYCLLELTLRRLYQGSRLFDDLHAMMRELGFELVGVSDVVRGSSGRVLAFDGVYERGAGR
jgi:FkbM family methyltransferase